MQGNGEGIHEVCSWNGFFRKKQDMNDIDLFILILLGMCASIILNFVFAISLIVFTNTRD